MFRSYILILTEHPVYILKGTACSLGIKEVDDGYKGEIEDSPNDIELPSKILYADWSNFDNFVLCQ